MQGFILASFFHPQEKIEKNPSPNHEGGENLAQGKGARDESDVGIRFSEKLQPKLSDSSCLNNSLVI